MTVRRFVFFTAFAIALAACVPTTTRPPFPPLPEAMSGVVAKRVPEATKKLADALLADSVPVSQIRQRDGYLETPWFDAKTFRPADGRPLGEDVVRVRGWIYPERPGSSTLVVEVAYRANADPSLDPRELDRAVPPSHPIAMLVGTIVQRLANEGVRQRVTLPDVDLFPKAAADSFHIDSLPPAKPPADSTVAPK